MEQADRAQVYHTTVEASNIFFLQRVGQRDSSIINRVCAVRLRVVRDVLRFPYVCFFLAFLLLAAVHGGIPR